MLYERKIRYLDYRVNGERVQGGGFVRLEAANTGLKMELAVMGPYRMDSLERDVLLCGGGQEKTIGKIIIADGKGEFRFACRNLDDIGGTGIRYGEWQGIRIPLGADREISGSWEQRRGGAAPKEPPKTPPQAPRKEEAAPEEPRNVMPQAPRKEEVAPEEPRVTMPQAQNHGTGEMTSMEMGRTAGRSMQEAPERESGEEPRDAGGQGRGGRRKGPAEKPIRLMDDKWQQLCAIYPRIRPFQDAREYLSIGPADFVLFPADSYKMVNNSFLLHGYYNYNHLLLARVEKKGEIFYYIGVPGSYFEKEKQVAIMFGFESFECAEEPAQPGDFGYYMMRVRL